MRHPLTFPLVLLTLLAPSAARAEAAPELPKVNVEVAFPNLQFDRPVAMDAPKESGNLLFVVEQHQAKVWSFPNEKETSDKKLFLQLPDSISRDNEEGFLGLAFHPKYKENGEFFVYYSADDRSNGGPARRSVVSRFKVSKSDPRAADPKSEERIWVSEDDPYSNHNGGCIAFGPDGYLYISLGDSGAADDPKSTGQNPGDWFGSILRIDVDTPTKGLAYGIPKDNPVAKGGAYARWAPEVYCIGLRNVWKFSFDRETGALWAGDVGQNLWEMVHLVTNGGNYGWSIKEAFHPFQPQRRQKVDGAARITPPIAEYPHAPTKDRKDTGVSITGGYVYRGKAVPELTGFYIYGDYETGRIWGVKESGGKATVNGEIVDLKSHGKLNIAAFGEDQAGEVYILAFDGKIYKFAGSK